MRLKQKTRYAIRILLCLTDHHGYVRADELSVMAQVPKAYLYNVVSALCDAGIVESSSGCKGGCRLRQSPLCISLYDILAATGDLFEMEEHAKVPLPERPEAQPSAEGAEDEEAAMLETVRAELALVMRCVLLDSFCKDEDENEMQPLSPEERRKLAQKCKKSSA